MKTVQIYILSLILLLFSCKKNELKSVKSYNYNELKILLEKKDDKIYVVNFWATWCAPCVKELPYFEKLRTKYLSKKVEVLLVSLDYPKQVKSRLVPFIIKNKIKSKVVLLDDENEDYWIKSISSDWTGSLPATLIYNSKKRNFYERSFDFETLENELKKFL